MAASKTINGSTNNQYWTYKLEVNETATDTANRTSTVKVTHYLGRKSSAGSSYFDGSYSYKTTVNGTTQTTNTSMSSGTIPAGGWKKIGEHTFTVSNTGNPTTIDIYGQQTSSIFSPSKSTASGTMDLTILHIPPDINSVTVAELNSTLTNLGVHQTIFVYYLSNKKFKFYASGNEGATITTYNVYYNNVLIGTSNTDEVTVDFSNIDITTNQIKFEVIDSMGGSSSTTPTFYYIPYVKPTIETSSTLIKRKTDGNTGLTDNVATLILNGNYYYTQDNEVGTANTITKIEYKIWNDTEPSYTDITNIATITIDTGSVSISAYDLPETIFFDKIYNYKIRITDYFGNTYELTRLNGVPTGVPLWTEFKDRVDFKKITQNNQPILMPYSLYTNDSGTNGTIALSDSAANYEFLEFYYRSDIGQHTSTKIYKPDGKKITLFISTINLSTSRTYVQTAVKTINGTSITTDKTSEVRIDSISPNTSNYIYITKIIGYK